MAYTEQQIETAINNVKHKAPIVREFSGYIVLGQNERDFEAKCRKIANGNRLGFYTIESALANCIITPKYKKRKNYGPITTRF